MSDRKELQEDDVLIYDIDEGEFIRNVKLPAFPQPAADVLLEGLKSLMEQKEVFINSGAPALREKRVNFPPLRNSWNIIGLMQH